MMIKTGVHRRLHTKSYCSLVGNSVIKAYKRGANYKIRLANVSAVLVKFKAFAIGLSVVSPY